MFELSSLGPHSSLSLDGHTSEAGNGFPSETCQHCFIKVCLVPVERSDVKLILDPLNTVWFFLLEGTSGAGLGRKNKREKPECQAPGSHHA